MVEVPVVIVANYAINKLKEGVENQILIDEVQIISSRDSSLRSE